MRICSRCLVSIVFLLLAASPVPAQNDSTQELGRLVTLAGEYEQQGRHQAAIDTYQKAERLAVALLGPNHVNVAALQQTRGLLHHQQGQYVEAQALLERSLKMSEVLGERELAAETINNLAAVTWELGRYLEAQKLHERSFEMFRKQYGEDSPEVAVSRNNLAAVYKSLGRTAEAEKFYLESIRVLERHQNTRAIVLADAISNLADLYTVQGELARAEPMFARAITIKEKAVGANHFEVGRTLNNLATLYATMGQYAKSEAMHRRTLRILEASLGPDHLDVARSLLNLAAIHQRLKQFDKAVSLNERALELRERQLEKDHPDVAFALHSLAGLYMDLNQPEKSQALYERALKIRESRLGPEHPTVAYTLMGLAGLKLGQGAYDEAERLYLRSLAIRQARLAESHPDLAYTHHGLALLYTVTQRWDQGATSFDLARRGFRRYVDQVLPGLSEVEQMIFLQEVDRVHYHAALSLPLKQPENVHVVELSAGWVVNGKALAQQTLAQRALLARDTSNPLVATTARYLQAVRRQLASLSLVGVDSQQSARQQAQLADLSRQEQAQSRELARLSGRAAGTSEWVETAKIRSSLPDDAALVEIARIKVYDDQSSDEAENAPEHYLAWIVPAAGEDPIRFVDLGEAEPIDTAVREVRTGLQEALVQLRELGEPEAEQNLHRVLRNLAERIWDPLLPALGERRKLYLSPDSLLWLVPWSALPLEGGEYAIEKYDVRFVVSGRDLVKNKTLFTPGRSIMVADPNYDLSPAEISTATATLFKGPRRGPATVKATSSGASKLGIAARLPGTRVEANAVRPQLEAYVGTEAYVYTEQWALEAVVKTLRQPRVLVLSTHGFFQQDESAAGEAGEPAAPGVAREFNNPLLRCGLLLAGCNHLADSAQNDSEDGILTGLEIVGTDLRGTELVVLSACETGLGEVRNGEGVAGLRQAFQLGGAKSVIATLWQIPDRETARLMSVFFAKLAQSGDKPGSLRAAQLGLIAGRRERNGAAHPFFWAAFTITGE